HGGRPRHPGQDRDEPGAARGRQDPQGHRRRGKTRPCDPGQAGDRRRLQSDRTDARRAARLAAGDLRVQSGDRRLRAAGDQGGRRVMKTLLLAKHDNKRLFDATQKALTAARELGGEIDVLVAGKDCRSVAEQAAKLAGVAKVLLAEDAGLEHRLAEPTAALIVSLAGPYDAIVAPATTTGKNVMP